MVLYVEDDGAGIDPEKMKKSTLTKGVITPEDAEQFSDREAIAIELIFRPAFFDGCHGERCIRTRRGYGHRQKPY